MKLILTIAIALSSFVAMAQTKTDTSVHQIDLFHNSVVDTSNVHFLKADTQGKAWLLNSYSFPKMYKIDWSKIKTFSDLKSVMQGFNFYITDDTKNFKKIKKFLIIAK
jgi:hypothetical protein